MPELPCGRIQGEAVLFGFDRDAFPFQYRLETHLHPAAPGRVVVPPGPPGSWDEFLRYYGTVIRIGGQFRMWYFGTYGPEPATIGYGHGLHPGKALCYALSRDGVHWTKPDLGLVAYHGSKENNIVDFPEKSARPAAPILYDPEDPNPARRFKLAYEADRGESLPQLCVAFSPDGLHWSLSPLNPVGPFMEMSGVAKFHRHYFVSGQDWPLGHQPFHARKLATYESADFEHWSPCAAVGLSRTPDLFGPSRESDSNDLEEVHLGAALSNRGNVLLGIYGQWHGSASGDRRFLTMDLGFTVSHDALHHEEPIPGFKMIPAREQPGSPAFDAPAVMQGQGMENVGDKTYYWYSLWKGDLGTGVRLAIWPRDRFGELKPFYMNPGTAPLSPQAISTPFAASGAPLAISVNASGLGPYAQLVLELLDRGFRPLPGFRAEISSGGFRVPVSWANHRQADPSLGEVRLKVSFAGLRPEDANLHAIYLTPLPSAP